MKTKHFVFTDKARQNWFFNKYYYSGSNSRYWTFQLALNLLVQRKENPTIVETGCQRQKEDLGAGMSTSIFGEFCSRYGGKVYTVDLFKQNLDVCKTCTKKYTSCIEYIESDSVKWLNKKNSIVADLLYLDSLDHPYGQLLELYGGKTDIQKAMKIVDSMSQDEILKKHEALLIPCQEHCLNEFKAAESSGKLKKDTIVLIDDNQLPGGGKSRLLKDHLHYVEWYCLLDLQQSLWIRKID